MELELAPLEGVFATRDRDEADDAPVTLLPAPREGGKRDPLPGYLVDLPAHVLEADDAIAEGKILFVLSVVLNPEPDNKRSSQTAGSPIVTK